MKAPHGLTESINWDRAAAASEYFAQGDYLRESVTDIFEQVDELGYAVVQLPEEHFAGDYALVHIEADEIQIDVGWVDGPDDARKVAAALLRAADQLEKQLAEERGPDGGELDDGAAADRARRRNRSAERSAVMFDAKAQFETEVTEHQMTVLHEEGVYRHIKFARPDSNMWRFDLVTWPGHLAISGDLQSYTFSRLYDMFEFFDERRINPHYWAEKVVAGRERTMEYSPERARQLVVEHFMEARHQRDELNLPLWQAIRSEVLSRLDEDEREAHSAISDFAYYLPDTPRSRSEDFKPESIVRRALSRRANFEFSDSWEWDLRDYDHHFLLICHAIRWGIAKYRVEVTARAA